MAWQHTIYAYPILLATAVSLSLAVYALRYRPHIRHTPTLQTFAAMNVAIAVWTAFSAIKLLSTDPAIQFQAYRFLYFGSSSVGPLLLLFILAYTDRITTLTPTVVAGVFAVPALFWILLFTNPYDVVIVETRVVTTDGLAVMRTKTGPAHILLSFTYALLIAVLTVGVLLFESFKRGWSYLPQASLLGIAIVTPVLVSGLTSAGVPPFTLDGVNLVPPSTAVSAIAMSVATFRYRLLDLRPVANRTVVENSPDGMLALDADGRIVHANETAQTLFDRSSSLVGTPISAVVPAVDFDTATETIIEYQSDAGPRNIELSSRELKRHGKTIGWVVVCRDITERTQREAELEAFTAVVSHDLRAPIRTTEQYLQALETSADSTLSQAEKQLLARSKQNAQRAQTMLSDLLAYSRIEPDSIEFEAVDMQHVVEDVVASIAYDIETRDAHVEIGTLPTVHGVEHLLARLIQNLLSNVLEHGLSETPNRSPALTISIEATRTGNTWVFAVADDGVGIEPDELTYAFDRFSQGSNADYDAGTGMGLAICKKIVDRHGGTISIESEACEGTTVTFTLPAVEAKTEGPSPSRNERRKP